MEVDQQSIILIVSLFLLIATVAGIAIPMIRSNARKERVKAVIEKRRKDLMQATRDGSIHRVKEEKVSAKDSMASLYKMQELAGDMGERMRDKLLQAGIRSPTAPLKFMIAKGAVPLGLCLFAMIIIAGSDKEVPNGMILLILFSLGFFGYKLPDILIKNKIIKRQQDIGLAFPDALDMMLICVQGGIGLEQTVDRVAKEFTEHSPVLAEELGILSAEMAMLNDRRQALQDFARRVGSAGAKSFCTALIQAEQYGTSISQAMRVIADEIRDMRMATAEQKAAALPPKLTVPMILFFLPALFIIILGPAGIEASASGVGK